MDTSLTGPTGAAAPKGRAGSFSLTERRKALLVTAAIVAAICTTAVALGHAYPSLYRGVEWFCP